MIRVTRYGIDFANHKSKIRAMLIVKPSEGKGRGVFTDSPIKKGAIIEECPVLLLSHSDADAIAHTILDSYIYLWWDTPPDIFCIVFGYGMLYNHSTNPNSKCDKDFSRNLMVFTALHDIATGEEITHNYTTPPSEREIIFKGKEWMYADTLTRE